MSASRAYVGMDIGGTYIKGMAFDEQGKTLSELSELTGDDGSEAWQERAVKVARTLLDRCGLNGRAGVAAPGLPSRDGRAISFMPGRLKGLENLNWQKAIGTLAPVPVLNDAQAALLGEVWMGAAKGTSNVVLLTLGTGVGGAAMVDGRVIRGHIGRAGHLGHVSLEPSGSPDITNTPGSLEDAIGGHTVSFRSGGKYNDTQQLVEAYRAGDQDAAEIWMRSVRALAAALTGFINVLDPELVVIGGGIADAEAALFKPLAQELDRMEWRPGGAQVRIVKAMLGKNAGAIGAAYAAKLEAEEV